MRKRTTEELLRQGARAFMMMIDPVDVPFKIRTEADIFMAGYQRRKREWQAAGNALIPKPFQEVPDRPRRTQRKFVK